MKGNWQVFSWVLAAGMALAVGCTTATHRYAADEVRETVAGFSEADINDTIARALGYLRIEDRVQLRPGESRAVLVVENVINDTNSRGRDAGALADSLGQSLREELTKGGKVVIFNERAATNAKVQVIPQYRLTGRLFERNLRQDNGDYQKEYNLNLTLVEIETGLEVWQKRIHVGKLVDEKNVLN